VPGPDVPGPDVPGPDVPAPGQGPGDRPGPERPPGPPRALIGDADRERLTALLREHYAAGRLTLDELRRRVGLVLAAAYADEAAAALAELPPVASAPQGTGGPAGPGQAGGTAGSAGPARARSRRRHGQAAEPQPGWVPTAERFRDPSSGTIMRVWTDPADGSRHYVPDTLA
jgi:DUF1707 SHOCT-like domain